MNTALTQSKRQDGGRLRLSLPSIWRKARRLRLFTGLTLGAGLLLLLALLLAWSPGKPTPFLDKKGQPLTGSIAEKLFVEINGTKQGMIIKGRNLANPVLLYLHGGMPDYFLTQRYPTGLEDLFTIVWWEQRGAGLSYSSDLALGSITTEQVITDTLAVTNYLCKRFGKEKIYLMGHSGGTFIGLQAAARAPELYYAYIGMAQMTNQLKSEKLAYEYMLAQFKAIGNTQMVQRLAAAPVTMTPPLPAAYLALRDEAMHSLGIGTMHEMKSVITGLLIPSLQFREYTLGEKINLWRAKARSGVSTLLDEMVTTDLTQQVTTLDLPVYFLHGIYDYTVSYSEAKAYFAQVKAPVKGFYTFAHSAHSPIFEEPGKMHEILQEDVLVGANTLADATD
ncbi:MAG: alpha/beta hydrolase [Caldilinea sp. CFX5]|nr:alpha/beta hydrolase [Caldilinea sp. CFX5]